MSISVCIVAHNEEEFIGKMLSSVEGICSELCFVDNGCIDNTSGIVQKWTAKQGIPLSIINKSVVNGFCEPYRQEVMDVATKEWTLFLDADEELTELGRNEIKYLIERRNIYHLPRATVILDKWNGDSVSPSIFYEYNARLFPSHSMVQKDSHIQHNWIVPRNGNVNVVNVESVQPYILHIRSGYEQLRRDKLRNQYPETRLPEKWEIIPGWFDYQKLYDFAFNYVPDNGKFVEVGSYLGKSIVYITEQMKRNSKKFELYSVDKFILDHTLMFHHEPVVRARGKFLPDFTNNLKMAKALDLVKIIQEDSVKASSLFDYDSLDFVFIDASHDYDSVLSDIKAWTPKVKKSGGILAGHDYSSAFPGVMQAVNENFPDADLRFCPGCWMQKFNY